MAETFAGFELPGGATIDSMEEWPSFAEWYQHEYGFAPEPTNLVHKEIFTAYVQGAYWQWHRMVFEG